MDHDVRNASPNVFNFIDFNNLNYGEVLSFLTPEIRKATRYLEKILKKKESLSFGAKFLETFIQMCILLLGYWAQWHFPRVALCRGEVWMVIGRCYRLLLWDVDKSL